MLGYEPFDIAQRIYENNIDPLVVIKKYIWALFNHEDLMLINQIPAKYREFFRKFWPMIWTNDPLRNLILSTKFYRYRIAPLLNCENLSQCLLLSFENVVHLEVFDRMEPSVATQEIIECFVRKKREIDDSMEMDE